MELYLIRANKKRDELLQQRGREWTREEKLAHEDEGDGAPFYRYTL